MPTPLCPHPTNAPASAHRIDVEVRRDTQGEITLTYQLRGNARRVLMPPPTMPQFTDGLWQHTCFEAFVATPGASDYREFNFSPSGQWASYRFAAYREKIAAPPGDAPQVAFGATEDGFILEVRIPSTALPPPDQPLQLGLSAVIEAADGTLSYWALAHPGERPDFHHPDAFVLTLPPAP